MSVSKSTRLGTRVRFVGYGVMYSNPPARGEEGEVTYMPGFKPRTYLPGPGGGLLYVKWDDIGVMGVSPNDLEKVTGSQRQLEGFGSFKAEVIADNSGRWVGNELRFATEKEANEYGLDLSMRWTAVRDVRTVESDDPVNYRYVKGRAERLEGLGEDESEHPWVRLSYGQLPDKKDVVDRVDGTYRMELTKSDARAIEECLMIVERKFAGRSNPFSEFPSRHGKFGYRFTPQGLYALIECIVEHDEEAAMDLVSSILQTLNIEWV
jgi:hypothetical protein